MPVPPTRRRFLIGSGAAGTSALAGCAGIIGDSETPTDGNGMTTAPPETTTSDTNTQDDPEGVYVLVHDMVRGNVPNVDQERTVGALANQFRPGERVKWRIAVVDGLTGEEVGPGVVDNVGVLLDDGTEIDATYGTQPLEADPTSDLDLDRYYTATWDIPTDHEAAVVDYSFTIDADRAVHSVHFETEDSRLTVLSVPPITTTTTTQPV